MKKGIFGGWFKELASLIFTQTVQAFLLAIIMSIIVNALTANGGDGGTYGAGLLAIIALSQFGKIEQMIKNIFGVSSNYGGSMQDGKGGLLGTMMALKAGKRVLDNAPKSISGVGNRIKANKTLKSLNEQKAALGDVPESAALGEMQDTADAFVNGAVEEADKFVDNASKGAGMQAGANMVNGGNGGGGVGISSSQIDQLISAVKEQTSTLKSQKADSDKSSKSDKMRELNEKIEAAKLQKREAGRQIRSGITETVGAVGGATIGAAAGAIVSMGTGDDIGSGIAKGAAFGTGVGDTIGGAPQRIASGIDNFRYDVKKIDKERKDAHNDRIYKEVTKSLKNANESGFMKNRSSADRAKAVKKLQENAKKKIDASNM